MATTTPDITTPNCSSESRLDWSTSAILFASERRQLGARALGALALANARYWSTVAGQVRGHLRRWESRATAIPDPGLRALALAKLERERFNAQAAAMTATLAPAPQREAVVAAIVALELLFDYLDGLTERPHPDPIGEGERLFTALHSAVDPATGIAEDSLPPESDDPYLWGLITAVRDALATLPSTAQVLPAVRAAAARSAEAQTRMHSVPLTGLAQLENWAQRETLGSGIGWREMLAGSASSVLALHALIVAAADRQTSEQEAERIDRTYLSIGVVVTLLDGLVDQEHDREQGQPTYVALYEEQTELAKALADAARDGIRRAAALRDGARHVMTLAGAVAYGISAPAAREEPVSAVLASLRYELRGLLPPPLLMMRAWRAAGRIDPRTRERPVSAKIAVS